MKRRLKSSLVGVNKADRLKRFLDEDDTETEIRFKVNIQEEIKKVQDCLVLSRKKLEQIKDSALFYPCSGRDLIAPIEIFSPYVTDFWFVDRGYFSPGHQDTRYFGFDVAADQQAPVLEEDSRYELISKMIKGPPVWNKDDRDITPCILTETYRHLETGREIRIHKRRGYGFLALYKEIRGEQLGVFFYRCDGMGEGGSGNLWLATSNINRVCNKMINGGLVVTDGSNEPERRHDRGHKELCRIRSCRSNLKTPEEFINFHQSFEDDRGRHFRCVGYAGMRCGPTMIWQVQKPVRRSWSD